MTFPRQSKFKSWSSGFFCHVSTRRHNPEDRDLIAGTHEKEHKLRTSIVKTPRQHEQNSSVATRGLPGPGQRLLCTCYEMEEHQEIAICDVSERWEMRTTARVLCRDDSVKCSLDFVFLKNTREYYVLFGFAKRNSFYCFVWAGNLVSHTKGRIQVDGV